MENKNEFDDIILEKSNKSEKIKKILLRVIALVILFLVVMIVMKLINTSENEENIVPQEPVAEFNTEKVDVIQMENDPAELEFESIKNTLQDDLKENNLTLAEENATSLPDNNLEISIKEQIQNDKIKDEQIIIKENIEKPVEVNKTKNEDKNVVVKKDNTLKQNPKENTNDLFENIGNSPVGKLAPGIYVQIFSVSNLDQKSRELAQVRKKGYSYKLYKTSVNGKEIHKVLIGPFKKDNIKKELEKIRADVAKDAFTFTIK